MKKIISLLTCMALISMTVLSFVACNKTSSTNNTANEVVNADSQAENQETSNVEQTSEVKTYKIGTLQLVQHDALDKTYQGFVDYLNEKNINFTMDFQNASGEQSACQTIADKFMNDNLDLIYAIATPAAQSVLAVDENVPIVASAVTDPASSKLCDTNENPGGILTAASDLTPVEAQFDLLKELLPNAKTVGILYCSAEANSKIQSDMAEAAAKKRDLESKVYTVTTSADIQTVVESMAGNVDVIYIPTDNTIAAGMETVATLCNDLKIPTICGEEGLVHSGGYATYGIDYYQLGRIAGELAEEILVNGKKPGDIPVRYLDSSKCTRLINEEVAEALGLPKK